MYIYFFLFKQTFSSSQKLMVGFCLRGCLVIVVAVVFAEMLSQNKSAESLASFALRFKIDTEVK